MSNKKIRHNLKPENNDSNNTFFSTPRIQNVVCTANVGSVLYLPRIAKAWDFCEYNSKRFAAITVRFNSPNATVLLFASFDYYL